MQKYLTAFLALFTACTFAFLVIATVHFIEDKNEAKRLQEIQQLVKQECGRK